MASSPSMTSKGPPAFPGKDLVRNVFTSVAESIDDMFFGPSMLDVMIQRLTRQAAEFAGIVGSGVNDEDLVAQALKTSGKTSSEDALMQLSGDLKPLEGETSTFSAPICDLVLAIFELNKKNNWLRRQAIVIILQQVLGGTIERSVILFPAMKFDPLTNSSSKLREIVKSYLDELRLISFINLFRNELWPGGDLKPPSTPRTLEEKLRTRDEANRKLSSLFPGKILTPNCFRRSNFGSRIGCKHDREVKRKARGEENICSPAEPPLESAYRIHRC
jgi:sorting nexin-25